MKILSVLFSKKTIIQYFLHLCFFISYFLTPSDIIEPFYNKEDWKSWDLAYLEAWKSQNKNIKQKTELEGEVVEDTPVTPETTTPVK